MYIKFLVVPDGCRWTTSMYLLSADLKTDWVASSADMSGNPYSKGFIGTKPFTLHMYMKFSVVPDCGRWTASRCIQQTDLKKKMLQKQRCYIM